MYPRLLSISPDSRHSFFLLGPRGTGKTAWVKKQFPGALYFDLLEADVYLDFLARPGRLEAEIPSNFKQWIIIDEIQRVPELLNEVHRLIEKYGYRFILTGSSARKLRQKGVNLLAGRALTYHMHPLTCLELQQGYNFEKALLFGQLPAIYSAESPEKYLASYVQTYLREEVMQEGLTRNLAVFARFLEVASFSQGNRINYAEIARETAMQAKTVSHYFDLLQDLLISNSLPVFSKRAKRHLVQQSKFYFFDVGVYRTIRPMGALDSPEEAGGAALETLWLQEMRAINDYFNLGYTFYFWHTREHIEVDFVAYGKRGLHAMEIKRKSRLTNADFKGVKHFAKDYPMAKCYLLYGGTKQYYHNDVLVIPIQQALCKIKDILS